MDAIRVGLISCWYKEKSCGIFAHNLASALQELGVNINVISANCLCFRDDPFRPDLFFSPCHKIKFADFYWKPSPRLISYIRSIGELTGDSLKGRTYLKKTPPFPILHYQQTQGSFGFLPLLSFLSYPTQAKRVVAVHEIDAVQRRLKVRSRDIPTVWLNKIYHKADAVIVQNRAFKEAIEGLGVDSKKVHIIPHGTHIPKLGTSNISYNWIQENQRPRIVFCGGHHLTSGKGFDVFLRALLILKAHDITPSVMIYGLNAGYGQEQGRKTICELKIDNPIEWFDYKSDDSLFQELQRALCMVIPYTKSEAGTAVTAAMANAVPVIATRNVGLPEYLGRAGLYIEEDDPYDLADKMRILIHDPKARETLGSQLHQRAYALYGWDTVAKKTLDLYKSLLGGEGQRIRVNPAIAKC
ncbi:MAG: glycosyltransferase family 4 protein [bacterium]